MNKEILTLINKYGWFLGFIIPVAIPLVWKYRRNILKVLLPPDRRRRLDNPEKIKEKLLSHPIFPYLDYILTEYLDMFVIKNEPLKTICIKKYIKISITELKKFLLENILEYPTIESETFSNEKFRDILLINYRAVNLPEIFLSKVLIFQKSKNHHLRSKMYEILTSSAYPRDFFSRKSLMLEMWHNYAIYVCEDSVEMLKLLNGEIESALIEEHKAGRFKVN